MALRRTWVVAGLGIVLAGTWVVTGISLVPVGLAIGPCLRDWTSPSSYRPRASPLATERFRVGEATVQLCYGRPSMRGRKVFGGLVPYDSLWRLGANEPTRLYTNRALRLGELRLEAGRYALYARPGPAWWTVYVTRSIRHWGNDFSPGVRAREVGHVVVPVTELAQPVETLAIRPDRRDSATAIHIAWERTGVTIPLEPGGRSGDR